MSLPINQRLSASCPYCSNIFAYEFSAASAQNGLDVLCPFCRQAVKLPMGAAQGQGQEQTAQRNLYLDSNVMMSPHFLSPTAQLPGSYSLQQQQQQQHQQQQSSQSLLVHPAHALAAAPFVSSNMATAALGARELADQGQSPTMT